jgi:SSS family solute:Na+ symporter
MYQGFEKNRNFLKDMKNVFVGIVWQTALVALPIFIVIKKPVPAMISFVISLATSIYLKIFWYNRLTRE